MIQILDELQRVLDETGSQEITLRVMKNKIDPQLIVTLKKDGEIFQKYYLRKFISTLVESNQKMLFSWLINECIAKFTKKQYQRRFFND